MGQYIPLNVDDDKMLNNFFCHFRFGEKHGMPDGFYRTILVDHWHITHREHMKNHAAMFIDGLEEFFSERSDKALDQTPAEFYAEVDKTTTEVGCNPEIIACMVCDFKDTNNSQEQYFEKFDVLEKYIRPIYIALRKKGYNKSDLWC